MPEQITPDDEVTRLARAYLGQLRGSAPSGNLPQRVVSSAMSQRRRLSLGALLGGAALLLAGASTAAIAVAMHHSPVPERLVGPVNQSPVVSSPSAISSPSPSSSSGPSPSAHAAASVSIHLVTAHNGVPSTGEGPGNFDFRAGHSLSCDNGIRYDNTIVVQLRNTSLVGSCLLSPNGLHYLYAVGSGVYVDGRPFRTVPPSKGGFRYFAGLSNDGQSVMYYTGVNNPDPTHGGQGAVTLYRDTIALLHTADSQVFSVAASADLQHYVAVDGPAATWVGPGPERVLYDGRVVMPLGGRDFFAPVISSNGMHWGVYISGSNGGGHAIIDGGAVQGPWECAALITDQGHWTMFNVVTNSVVTDGVSRHVTVDSLGNAWVALTDDGAHRAALVNGYTSVLTVDGTPRAVPPYASSIEFVGTTLYVYYTAT